MDGTLWEEVSGPVEVTTSSSSSGTAPDSLLTRHLNKARSVMAKADSSRSCSRCNLNNCFCVAWFHSSAARFAPCAIRFQ
eukprot:5472609-Prorocentrum_lima.AAC.1